MNEVLSSEEVNEIADTPPGATQAAVDRPENKAHEVTPPSGSGATGTREVRQSVPSVRRDGKVEFHRSGDAEPGLPSK